MLAILSILMFIHASPLILINVISNYKVTLSSLRHNYMYRIKLHASVTIYN